MNEKTKNRKIPILKEEDLLKNPPALSNKGEFITSIESAINNKIQNATKQINQIKTYIKDARKDLKLIKEIKNQIFPKGVK